MQPMTWTLQELWMLTSETMVVLNLNCQHILIHHSDKLSESSRIALWWWSLLMFFVFLLVRSQINNWKTSLCHLISWVTVKLPDIMQQPFLQVFKVAQILNLSKSHNDASCPRRSCLPRLPWWISFKKGNLQLWGRKKLYCGGMQTKWQWRDILKSSLRLCRWFEKIPLSSHRSDTHRLENKYLPNIPHYFYLPVYFWFVANQLLCLTIVTNQCSKVFRLVSFSLSDIVEGLGGLIWCKAYLMWSWMIAGKVWYHGA